MPYPAKKPPRPRIENRCDGGDSAARLTADEKQRYGQIKTYVREWSRTVRDGWRWIGMALREARWSRLYREEYPTFESFCEAEFGFGRRRANQLMGYAGTADQVASLLEGTDKPEQPIGRPLAESEVVTWDANGNTVFPKATHLNIAERAVRRLTGLSPERQASVVQLAKPKAVEAGELSEAAVLEALQQVKPSAKPSKGPNMSELGRAVRTLKAQFVAAAGEDGLEDEIEAAFRRLSKWAKERTDG